MTDYTTKIKEICDSAHVHKRDSGRRRDDPNLPRWSSTMVQANPNGDLHP